MRNMGIIIGALNKGARVRLVRVVGELPVSRVKLQRFCRIALVKSEIWQGNREETATARKVKYLPEQDLEFHTTGGYTSLGGAILCFANVSCSVTLLECNWLQRNEAFDMRKAVLLCVLSAILGGLASFGLHSPHVTGCQTAAQEASPWSPQAGPAASQPVAGGPSQLDSLTAEERVNVFVYQQVNRGVVNINTKGVTGNIFVTFESQGEGSGSVIDRAGPRA